MLGRGGGHMDWRFLQDPLKSSFSKRLPKLYCCFTNWYIVLTLEYIIMFGSIMKCQTNCATANEL